MLAVGSRHAVLRVGCVGLRALRNVYSQAEMMHSSHRSIAGGQRIVRPMAMLAEVVEGRILVVLDLDLAAFGRREKAERVVDECLAVGLERVLADLDIRQGVD